MDAHRNAYISDGNIRIHKGPTYEELYIPKNINPSQIVSGHLCDFMYILDGEGKVYTYDYDDKKILPIIDDDCIIQISRYGQFMLFLSVHARVYCHSWQLFCGSISFTPVTILQNLTNINKTTGTMFYALFLDNGGDLYFKGKFKVFQSDINTTKLNTIGKIKDIHSSCYTSLLIDVNNNTYLLPRNFINIDAVVKHFVQLDEYKHISISDEYMLLAKNNGDINMFIFDNRQSLFIINPLDSNGADDILGIDACTSKIFVYIKLHNEQTLLAYDIGIVFII